MIISQKTISEMSLEELKALKSIIQYAIHEKEGVAA